MLKCALISFMFILHSQAAFSILSINDAAEGFSTIAETWHRLSNMYFYAAIGLITINITTIGKLKRGAQFRPTLSRSVAFALNTSMVISILFLVIHFMPEMETIFDVILGWIGRLF